MSCRYLEKYFLTRENYNFFFSVAKNILLEFVNPNYVTKVVVILPLKIREREREESKFYQETKLQY